jgi:hypothetical protein
MPVDRREREKRESRRQSASDWVKQQDSGQESCIRIPQGYERYKLEQGTHELDFMPSRAGAVREKMAERGADEGFEVFEMTYKVHWIPDISGKSKPIACRAFCFNEPCAICDKLRKEGGTMDPDLRDALRDKTRHVWLVNDKPGDAKNKPKFLDTHDKNRGQGFAEVMADAINSVEWEDHPFTLDKGYKARMVVKPLPRGNGQTYNAATRIDLKSRDYEYPEKLLDSAPCLDACLIDPGYDEVEAMLDGRTKRKPKEENGEDQSSKRRKLDDEDSAPPARAKKKTQDEEDDAGDSEAQSSKRKAKDPTAEDLDLEVDEMVIYKGREHKILKISGDGTSLKLEDDLDGDVVNGIAPSDVQKKKKVKATPKDEDEDAPPARAKKKTQDEEDDAPAPKKKKAAVKDDDDLGTDDLDDEDSPPARKKKARDEEDDDLDDPLDEDDD